MTDRYEKIRKALEMGPTPGPWKLDQYLGSPRQFVIHMDVGDKGRGSDVAFTSAAFGNDETIANASFIAAANPAAISELLDRLEAAESDGLEQARLNGMGGEREAALLSKLEAAEKERDKYKLAYSLWREKTEWVQERINSGAISQKYLGWHRADVVSDLLKKAEKERDALRTELKETWHRAAAAENTIKSLRAKIEQMEKQEPVAWMLNCQTLSGDTGWILSWTQSGAGLCNRLKGEENEKRLYALPGAQPAPSAPDGWLPVPEKHPTFDPVDLQLSDGSVLCGCVPQADGDYWWEGPSGEVFIDPKYANVTHWRLAAAPEDKP